MAAPFASEALLRQHLETLLGSSKPTGRAVIVRARPVWSGAELMSVADRSIRVATGISSLAALDAIRSAEQDELVVVLTELSESELGSAVMADAGRRGITQLDPWGGVGALFGLRGAILTAPLRELGTWVPDLLAAWRRERGYPQLPRGAVLTPVHVVRALLLALLDLDATIGLETPDALARLDDPATRARLRELEPHTLQAFTGAVATHAEQHLAMAIRTASTPGSLSPVAVGVTVGELWKRSEVDAETAAARVRIEQHTGVVPTPAIANRFGQTSQQLVQRWLESDPVHADGVLEQVEALCVEIGWSTGAAASDFLPNGLGARIGAFAAALTAAADAPDLQAAAEVDRRLAEIEDHALRKRFERSRSTALMATRLIRWLRAPVELTATLEAALAGYAADGGWAERALGDLWDGDGDRALADAYGRVAAAVQARRKAQDRDASSRLTGSEDIGPAVIPVERVLERIVLPLSRENPILLIVLDGMSVPTALELGPQFNETGWSELVRQSTGRRDVALSALPSVTAFSRTSLFAGTLLAGSQQTEKARFAAAVKGIVFHKDDLRSRAGHALPETVADAIADVRKPIVAAVLNTIDDALANSDVDALRWSVSTIANLEALLAAAAAVGRTVVLTSDHGHIVERGSELRPVAESAARWRPTASGPVTEQEVVVSGTRVLTPGNEAVLAVDDGIRYASKKAGYHGGASLSELAIPIMVLRRRGAATPPGWIEAPPQEPEWWNEPSRVAVVGPDASKPSGRKRRPALAQREAPTLFDTEPTSTPDGELNADASHGQRLVASELYGARRGAAGRHPVDDATTVTIVDALMTGGGRAHLDTLAARVGVSAHAFNGMLTALRRVLNVDGYPVIDLDPDRTTVRLDTVLLREQFGLRGS